MNAFEIASVGLLAELVPLLLVAVRGGPGDGLVALELAGAIVVLALLCFAEGFHRSVYYTVPVAAAVMSWIGGLTVARLLGRMP